MLLSRSEQETIQQGCLHGCRADGRRCDESRKYKLICSADGNSLPLVSGSARLLGHGQHILCSVKAEIVKPATIRPNEGTVELHVDSFMPGSHKEHDHTAAVLSQLLADQLVDTKRLCIVPGQYAWRLHVDLYILSSQGQTGNFLDASSHVIRAALRHTLLPSITPVHKQDATKQSSIELSVDSDIRKARPPEGDAPVVVTISLVKCAQREPGTTTSVLLVDATPLEQACSYAQVHVAVQGGDYIVAVHKSQTGSLAVPLLAEITQLAVATASQRNELYSICSDVCNDDHSLLQGMYSFQ